MKVIIVAGISGIDKKTFIKNFIKKAEIEKKSYIIRFEDELVNRRRKAPNVKVPTSITSFLDLESAADKVQIIEQTFNWISENLKLNKDVEYVFLDIHLAYYKKTEYFPPLNPTNFNSLIDSINLDAEVKIINLIDDVFNIWQILKERERRYPNTKLSLREILGWRSIETLQSESLEYSLNSPGAGKKQANSYMVSVRHPFATFRDLIFEETPLTLYLSFPISKTRNTKNMVDEINEFRTKMYQIGEKVGVSVFDPVTIDELILEQAKKLSKSSTINLNKKMRWPLNYKNILIKEELPSIRIPRGEITESKKVINHQVRSRDLKLVGAAALLAVYRPFWPELSLGVKKEVDHATSIGNEVCIYSPLEDKIPKSGNPFDDNITSVNNIEKYYNQVEEILIDLKKKIINHNETVDEE